MSQEALGQVARNRQTSQLCARPIKHVQHSETCRIEQQLRLFEEIEVQIGTAQQHLESGTIPMGVTLKQGWWEKLGYNV